MITPFVLHRPSTLEEACSLLAEYGSEAKILAGGSELVLVLKNSLVNARHIVDLKSVGGLDRIELDPQRKLVRIGALVTHRMLETSQLVRECFPVVSEMERQVANVRIRNVGTLAGNLSFAEPRADPGTLLFAYQAFVKVRSLRGERTLPIADFFVDFYETALREDEIVTEIEIPLLDEKFAALYRRFCPGERPTLGMALLMEWSDGVCKDARLVLGCLGPKPIRLDEVEKSLRGKTPKDISAKASVAAEEAASLIDPIPDIWGSVDYKRQIVKAILSRALGDLCHRRSGDG